MPKVIAFIFWRDFMQQIILNTILRSLAAVVIGGLIGSERIF